MADFIFPKIAELSMPQFNSADNSSVSMCIVCNCIKDT